MLESSLKKNITSRRKVSFLRLDEESGETSNSGETGNTGLASGTGVR